MLEMMKLAYLTLPKWFRVGLIAYGLILLSGIVLAYLALIKYIAT